MATPGVQANNTGSESIIAGYFHSGEDAHRAISALLDEGFLASQIGAAFHTNGGGAAESSAGKKNASEYTTGNDSMRQELSTTLGEGIAGSDNSVGGPASDTSAVQPAGLATGTGSPFLGVGKPGPISGSSLENTGLPSELRSELAHDQPGSASAPRETQTEPYVGSRIQPHFAPTETSWTAKLKHLFQSKKDEPVLTASAPVTTESQNFGSGSGHLNLAQPHGRPYSPSSFENSISGAGIPSEHSRHISRRLNGGGAVVTVNDTGRTIEVEKIFERHNGVVRFASSTFDDSPAVDYEPRIEVFGHLEHRYPAL